VRFLLDESTDAGLILFLRVLGHDTIAVVRSQPGLPDIDVLALANDEHRILLTDDRDFGQLVFQLRLPHAGVILFRLRHKILTVRQRRLEEVLEQYPESLDEFIVVTDWGFRIAATG
jgi:predicted nuclease of predicted toxin-antitoxin system